MHIEGFTATNVKDVEIEIEAEIVEEAGIVEVEVEVTSIKNYGKKLFFLKKFFEKFL